MTSFNQAVEVAMKKDSRYGREAYVFLLEVLELTIKQCRRSKREFINHVSAAELLECFRLHALEEFGPMALTVLSYWGVHTSEDIGSMVLSLVDAKFLAKTEEDTLEAFRKGFSFEEAFTQPFQPIQKK